MAVSTEAVQITINVTDANSSAAVNQVKQNIESMGNAGATSGKKVVDSLDKIESHTLQPLDKVRLLRDDLGIRMPRAMEKAIASSRILMGAIGAVGTGLLAIGAVDIGVRIGKGLYDAYEKWISLGAAAKAYHQEVLKSQDEDFINVRDIETATDRIKLATEAATAFQEVAHQTSGNGWKDMLSAAVSGNAGAFGAAAGSLIAARQMSSAGFQLQTHADALREPGAGLQHQAALDAIELAHAGDARLRGEQKITAEKNKQHAIDEENREFEVEVEGLKGNKVDPNAGKSRQAALDAIADQKADADTFNLRREQGIELQHMREAALEAGLRGSALYRAQEAAAIEELKNKDMDSVAARKAVHDKFHAEELRRLQDENREIQKMREETALGALTGVARTQQEGRNKVNDIVNDPNSQMNPGQRLAAIHEVTQQTQQTITKEYQDFADHVDGIVAQSADRAVSGFARIHADAQRQIQQLKRDASEKGATPADVQRGEGAIRQSEADQVADLQRKNAEETSQIESEARAKLLSAEKNQTAAIADEYAERVQKYKDQLTAQEISQTDFDRRVLAAGELRDAEMVESAQRAREKMAGEFTSFFRSLDHPKDALKEMGDKVAGQAAAGLVQTVQGHFSGGTPAEGKSGGVFGGLMNHIAGTPHAHGAGASGSTAHSVAPSAVISLGTAQISIGSASLTMGGAGASSSTGGASGGFSTSGGSTGLFAPTGSRRISSGSTATGGASDDGGSELFPQFVTNDGSSGSTASPVSFAGSTGAGSAAPRGATGSVIGNAEQGMGLFSQGKSMLGGLFGAKKNTSDAAAGYAETQSADLSGTIGKDGSFSLGKSGTGMLNGGSVMGNLGGAAGGAMGMYSAVEGNGGVGGALSGAMSGMQLGSSLGGPIGAGIGAAAGAIVGALGIGGQEKAKLYYLKTVQPRIVDDTDAYQQGQMDYGSAYSDLQSLDEQARKALEAMGTFGKNYYWGTVNGEIKKAADKLTGEERSGRSQYTASAAQFAIGTDSVPRDGFAMIHQNERIMPSDQNERITRAIEGGAEGTKMAAQPQSSWGGDIHIHAIDAKSSVQWLMANKHNVRSAMNASYAENSGGADA